MFTFWFWDPNAYKDQSVLFETWSRGLLAFPRKCKNRLFLSVEDIFLKGNIMLKRRGFISFSWNYPTRAEFNFANLLLSCILHVLSFIICLWFYSWLVSLFKLTFWLNNKLPSSCLLKNLFFVMMGLIAKVSAVRFESEIWWSEICERLLIVLT